MTTIGWCGAAIAAASAALLVRGQSKDASTVVSALAAVFLTGAAISALAPALSFMGETGDTGTLAEYMPTLLKALAVACCTAVTADICRDVGDTSIASRVELFGRAQIVLLALPLARELIQSATALLS
jgi:stage III sporulation protein AD